MSERLRPGKPEADISRRGRVGADAKHLGLGREILQGAKLLLLARGLGTRELVTDIEVTEAARHHADGMVERVAQALEKFA